MASTLDTKYCMTPDHLRILVVHDDIMTFTMILDVIFSAKFTLVLGTLRNFTLKVSCLLQLQPWSGWINFLPPSHDVGSAD